MPQLLDGNVLDQVGRPVPGALVYIYDSDGDLATLTDAMGSGAQNPVTAGEDGYWGAFVGEEGFYTLRYFWGERERLVQANVIAGRSPIEQAEAAAAVAVAASGPNYASTAAGIADTAEGATFPVDTGGIVTVYRHDAGGVATALRTLLSPEALAAAGGAAGVGTLLSGSVADVIAANPIRVDGLTNDAVIDTAGVMTGTNNAAAFANSNDAIHGVYEGENIPAGKFLVSTTLNIPADISAEYRDTPFSFLGAWTGEPYIADAQQKGTTIACSSTTTPTIKIQHRAEAQGAGSIEFGKMRVVGKQNAGVPVIDIEGLSAHNHIHDLSVFQYGAGDGIHAGWLITTPVERVYLLNQDWLDDTKAYADRTGVGFEYTGDRDHALAKLTMTVRGFQTSMRIGATSGTNKVISTLVERSEASVVGDGPRISDLAENTTFINHYGEIVSRFGMIDRGRYSTHINPHSLLSGTAEMELQGRVTTVIGGQLGVKADGSIALNVQAGSAGQYGVYVLGTAIIKGQSGSSTGVQISTQSDPKGVILPAYDPTWAGGSGDVLTDNSNSSLHGGSGGVNGSGFYGLITRRSGGGRDMVCLSRGSYNRHIDETLIESGNIAGGLLPLTNASAQVCDFVTPVTVSRISALNLPDKTGLLIIKNGNVTFTDDPTRIVGLNGDLVLAAGEAAIIEYQALSTTGGYGGATGAVVFTNVRLFKPKMPSYTVATLPTGQPAGAQAFATNARNAGEGAGVGTGSSVVFDGTNWKIPGIAGAVAA